jgi:CelD/BcsL family acetyltransferase involved in cellulose biosynthesis
MPDVVEAAIPFHPPHLQSQLPLPQIIALPAWEIYHLQSATDLERTARQWEELCEHHGGPIEQMDWVQSCAATAPAGTRLDMVAVFRQQVLAAVAALVVQRRRGVPWRSLIGVDRFHEPMDLLARSPQALQVLTSSLARSGLPLELNRVPETSPTLPALRQAFAGRAIIKERSEGAAPYLLLDDPSWTDPEQHLSSRRRSDLRRARRRAEQIGTLTTEIIVPEPGQVDSLLDTAFHIEQASWKGESQTALACDPQRGEFFRLFAKAAASAGRLRICFLRIDGRPVAMQIATVHAKGFWLLKIGYDSEFSRCSPGMLLLSETIAHAAREGLASYQFLGQADTWINIWTELAHQTRSIRIYPLGSWGLLALAVDSAAWLRKRVSRQAKSFAQQARRLRGQALAVVASRAARGYIAGESLTEARNVQQKLVEKGFNSTLGYWDAAGESPRQIVDQYLQGLELLGKEPGDGYLSIKVPSLNFSPDLLDEVLAAARLHQQRVHFDALQIGAVPSIQELVTKARASFPDVALGVTLPGRWRRSVADADWVAQNGLYVRVVKGQWADPDDPKRNLREGFLEVIDALAGKARHVSVATHDLPLAAEAIRRLQLAETPCDIELLYGLPMRAICQHARAADLPVRIYVPYGAAYLPYALDKLRHHPGKIWWLMKDFVGGLLR